MSYFNVHVYKLTLEERSVHIGKVTGSIPVVPTKVPSFHGAGIAGVAGLREAERNEQGTLGYEIETLLRTRSQQDAQVIDQYQTRAYYLNSTGFYLAYRVCVGSGLF